MKLLIGLLFGLIIGCATSVSGLLRFQDRELLPHPDLPGLAYPHKITICEDRPKLFRVFGKKCRQELKIDFYDLNLPDVRKQIVDAGFTCVSPGRFKY